MVGTPGNKGELTLAQDAVAIMAWRYCAATEQKTLTECASILGISREHARQIEMETVETIRAFARVHYGTGQ